MLAETTAEWISTGATVAGAVGTFAAVSVALWQSNRQQRRDVKVTCSKAGVAQSGLSQLVLDVGVHNVGFRPITLTGVTLLAHNGTGIFMAPHPLSDELPKLMADGDSAHILLPQDAVDNAAPHVDGFFAVAARDSLGNSYFARYPGGPRGPLWFYRRRAKRRAVRHGVTAGAIPPKPPDA